MAILLKVHWADVCDQLEQHQCIREIGGVSGRLKWKHTQGQAIEFIENSVFDYYLQKDDQALKLAIALTADGTKYLAVQNNKSGSGSAFSKISEFRQSA
jgi:hypothetical protein